MAAPSRNLVFAPWLDRRAYSIDDPVQRLAFLRREMELLELEESSRTRRHNQRLRVLTGAVCVAFLALFVGLRPARTPGTVARAAAVATPHTATVVESETSVNIPGKVWLVDRSGTMETYSNGLHIDVAFAVSNRARERYRVYPSNGGAVPARYGIVPAGIVYHTTESHLAPFAEEENRRLKQFGKNVLEIIRRDKSYHYVVDRFGRVFRVVEESNAANHAGRSVWADRTGIYVNLNDSFLGVAFEGQTGAAEQVTTAQISAGRMLTEMLRARYSIAAEDCVTHAQVSVNPANMHIGVHTDWAAHFPFTSLGLPDNYSLPLASFYAFGFEYDGVFLEAIGDRWAGLDLSEREFARRAGVESTPPARYRAILQRRYRDIISALEEAQTEGGS